MKKVFFILPTIGFGGAEKVYIEISSALSKLNKYDVELLYLTRIPGEQILPKELKIKCFNVTSTKSGYFKLLKYLKKNNPDIVFSSLTHLNVMMIIMKKLNNLSFKLYVRQTNNLSNILQLPVLKRNINLILHMLYKYADGVIFQSDFMYQDFIDLIPIKNKFYVIGNPVSVEKLTSLAYEYQPEFKQDENIKNIFIYIGRLVKIKNIDYLIYSFSKYSNKEKSKLLIIGEGSEHDRLNKLINELKLEGYVYILGSKINPFPYIKNANALFLCSKSEGFPNVVLESLALDTPVFIRKHIGGTEEILRKLNLSKYYLNEIDFDVIEKMIDTYPKNLSKITNDIYGIDSIVGEYIKLIEMN